MILEHLDTLIAFVVILAGVSLLVTVFTQIVSAFLGLRGTNLRWGIETLLKEVDPSLKAYAKTIAEHVLHHPLISDSTLLRMGFRVLAKICDANTRLDQSNASEPGYKQSKRFQSKAKEPRWPCLPVRPHS